MNKTLENIRNRRSVRKFNDIPVADDILQDIIEAGRWAPTGGNSQTVHFTVLMNSEIQNELREMVQEEFAQMELSENLYISLQHSIRASKHGGYAYDYHAPILIIVSNVKGYPNAIADSACALMNMMLTANSYGVGTCWINQLHWLDENSKIRSLLSKYGIDEGKTICGALAVGNYDGEYTSKERTGMRVNYIIDNQ